MSEAAAVPLRRHLLDQATSIAVVQTVGLTVVAALAVSRADNHMLSPGFLAGVLAVAGLAAGLVGWPAGFYEGAHAVLAGRVDPGSVRSDDEPTFGGDHLRTRALRWAGALAAWAGAAGLLVAAVLGGEHAPFLVTAVALVVIGGGAALAGGLVARVAGLTAARRALDDAPAPRSLRARAWRDIAVPMAIAQGILNAGFAVLLFHDYPTGDTLEPGALTGDAALADALVVVVLLTALFGTLAGQWGRVDGALGRVHDDGAARVDAKHPLGRQGLVYVALAGLVGFSLAGLLVPAHPTLARVAVVRALLAGTITAAVCGVAYVRGALNTLGGASELAVVRVAGAATDDDEPPRANGARRSRAVMAAQVALVAALLGLVVRPPSTTPRAVAADTPPARLAAEGEAFVARVEYDVPLPAGTGTVAHVAGRVGPPSGDNAYGLAAAPSHLDAVVSGTWFNPLADEDPFTDGDQAKGPVAIPDENRLPYVECFHPGNDLDLRFTFPTDVRADTSALPPLGYATAHCAAGPETEVHSRTAHVGGKGTATATATALFTSGPAGADGLFRPVEGVLESSATAWADDVELLGGLVHIGAVGVDGASAVDGTPGRGRTHATVHLKDVTIGTAEFDVEGDRVVVAGEPQPVDSGPARDVLAQAAAALEPAGCDLSVVGPTPRYPQGFVLGREDPAIGLRADGTLAASMAGGLLFVCDIPQALSEPTGFNPQRMQVLVGFVYTGASAIEGVGGFGLGGLGGGPIGAVGGAGDDGPAVTVHGVESNDPGAPSKGVQTPPPPAEAAGEPVAPAAVAAVFRAVAGVFGEWPVWVAALVAWAALTNLGVRRIQGVVARASVVVVEASP